MDNQRAADVKHVPLTADFVDLTTADVSSGDLSSPSWLLGEETDFEIDLAVGSWARLTRRQEIWKRLFDITVATLGLVVLFPALVVLAVAIAASSRGPVLYRGTRVGKSGQHFEILKFRSMVRDAEHQLHSDALLLARYVHNGYKLPSDVDPRLTRLGRILRRTSLDELPQVWNVIRGDMSLVGARPVVPSELPEYGELVGAYLSARPGLTGHWQVEGRGIVGFPERAYLDLLNLENWSLLQDARLVLKTVPVVLSRRGAY